MELSIVDSECEDEEHDIDTLSFIEDLPPVPREKKVRPEANTFSQENLELSSMNLIDPWKGSIDEEDEEESGIANHVPEMTAKASISFKK